MKFGKNRGNLPDQRIYPKIHKWEYRTGVAIWATNLAFIPVFVIMQEFDGNSFGILYLLLLAAAFVSGCLMGVFEYWNELNRPIPKADRRAFDVLLDVLLALFGLLLLLGLGSRIISGGHPRIGEIGYYIACDDGVTEKVISETTYRFVHFSESLTVSLIIPLMNTVILTRGRRLYVLQQKEK